MEISLSPHCFAAAAAKIVFPVPGKPYNSKPDCRRKGAFPNNLGNYEINKYRLLKVALIEVVPAKATLNSQLKSILRLPNRLYLKNLFPQKKKDLHFVS